jgi:hypothetical protein
VQKRTAIPSCAVQGWGHAAHHGSSSSLGVWSETSGITVVNGTSSSFLAGVAVPADGLAAGWGTPGESGALLDAAAVDLPAQDGTVIREIACHPAGRGTSPAVSGGRRRRCGAERWPSWAATGWYEGAGPTTCRFSRPRPKNRAGERTTAEDDASLTTRVRCVLDNFTLLRRRNDCRF